MNERNKKYIHQNKNWNNIIVSGHELAESHYINKRIKYLVEGVKDKTHFQLITYQ
jgi:hypothetical protein